MAPIVIAFLLTVSSSTRSESIDQTVCGRHCHGLKNLLLNGTYRQPVFFLSILVERCSYELLPERLQQYSDYFVGTNLETTGTSWFRIVQTCVQNRSNLAYTHVVFSY